MDVPLDVPGGAMNWMEGKNLRLRVMVDGVRNQHRTEIPSEEKCGYLTSNFCGGKLFGLNEMMLE